MVEWGLSCCLCVWGAGNRARVVLIMPPDIFLLVLSVAVINCCLPPVCRTSGGEVLRDYQELYGYDERMLKFLSENRGPLI